MDGLTTAQLLDCEGRVTHTLTLLADGRVEIRFAAGARALVDPVRRATLTPGVTVPDPLMDACASLTPFG